MATKVQIYNLALTRLGEALLVTDSDDTNPADVLNAVYTPILEDMLNIGPEEGWKFAKRRKHGILRDSATITAIAQNGTDITVTATHALEVGDEVTIAGTTSYDGTYDVTAISTTATFDVTATFVADDATGTAKWTSEEFAYRYARPTCTRVTSVQVGGRELMDWVREGQYILTNQEDTDVDMTFVQDASVITVGNIPPQLVDVLWRKLAVHLCYDLVQNASIQQQLLTELEQIYIPRALGMDNREQYVQELSTAWVDAGRKRSYIE
jgi:hypothetical protein